MILELASQRSLLLICDEYRPSHPVHNNAKARAPSALSYLIWWYLVIYQTFTSMELFKISNLRSCCWQFSYFMKWTMLRVSIVCFSPDSWHQLPAVVLNEHCAVMMRLPPLSREFSFGKETVSSEYHNSLISSLLKAQRHGIPIMLLVWSDAI